jgi:hypothetical protein
VSFGSLLTLGYRSVFGYDPVCETVKRMTAIAKVAYRRGTYGYAFVED